MSERKGVDISNESLKYSCFSKLYFHFWKFILRKTEQLQTFVTVVIDLRDRVLPGIDQFKLCTTGFPTG